MSSELDLSQLHTTTSEELYTESMADATIKTGTYLAKTIRAYPRKNDDDAAFHPGREHVSLFVKLCDPEDPSVEKGSCYVKASWQRVKTARGQNDRQCQLWLELVKAVGATGVTPIPEVIAMSSQSMFLLTVDEKYVVAQDEVHPSHQDQIRGDESEVWVTVAPDEDDERMHYIEAGYEAKIQAKRIRKV